MIDRLRKLLEGKRVELTHTNPHLGVYRGICLGVRPFNGGKEPDHFIIALDNDQSIGFVAEDIGPDFVDGPLRTQAGGRRRVDVLS